MTATANPGTSEKPRAPKLSPQEQDVVKRLAIGIGWPTMVLALGLLVTQIGGIVVGVKRLAPWPIVFFVNSWVGYAWYTVHHDATHKAISGRDPNRRWLDTTFGQIAGVMMQLEFKGYAQNHLKHHAHTNTDQDPDLIVKGPLWQMPIKWAVGMVFMSILLLPGGGRVQTAIIKKLSPAMAPSSERDKRDARRQRLLSQAAMILLLATIPLGGFKAAFLLWYLPGRVGGLYLTILFQWLPHFPFDRTDRWGNTRVTRWPGSTWMMLQQDRHLIHHLYPSIPWFRYRQAFRELRPLIEANHAIIQGIDTSPHVPIQLREAS